MQIKTTMKYHLTPGRIAFIKSPQKIDGSMDAEKKEHLSTAGGTAN